MSTEILNIRGVFLLPRILTVNQIQEAVQLPELRCHHNDGGGHFRAQKPHRLPSLAKEIFRHVPKIDVNGMSVDSVDLNMQFYRLGEGDGVVPPHVDEDFELPDGNLAFYSILMYLNEGFTGGETIFNRNTIAPHIPAGSALLFKHDILHEGRLVLSGEKLVLKTDLLFKR